jgi:hypothetical protein
MSFSRRHSSSAACSSISIITKPPHAAVVVETASTVNASDEDDWMDDSSSERSGGTALWESRQNHNVASGLFVKNSRPLPLSVSRTVPWPRLWGRRRKHGGMAMECTDFVTRLDEPTHVAVVGGGRGMAYFRTGSSVDADDKPKTMMTTTATSDILAATNRSTGHGVPSVSSSLTVLTRRCSTG